MVQPYLFAGKDDLYTFQTSPSCQKKKRGEVEDAVLYLFIQTNFYNRLSHSGLQVDVAFAKSPVLQEIHLYLLLKEGALVKQMGLNESM